MFDRSHVPRSWYVFGQEIHRDQAVAFRKRMLPLALKLDTQSPNLNCFITDQNSLQKVLALSFHPLHTASVV